MTREILFRGKRVDNGEWVIGYLVRGEDYLYETEMTTIFSTDTIFYPHTETSGYDRVIADTVGQFTGLCDKNGKKIFEGDIVRFYDKDWTANGIATVDFEKGRWKINGHYTTKLSSIVWLDLYRTGFEYEVVGNIYDNPELLEEKL